MPTVLATLRLPDSRVLRDPTCGSVELVLSREVWQAGMCIGDLVIVETDQGSVFSCYLEVGLNDTPIVRLGCALEAGTRVLTVRKPHAQRAA